MKEKLRGESRRLELELAEKIEDTQRRLERSQAARLDAEREVDTPTCYGCASCHHLGGIR